MEVIIKCGEEIVNEHGNSRNTFSCPFGVHIPSVGDFIELGEHTEEFKHKEFTPQVLYVVKSRTFSAIEDYNNIYSRQRCVLNVEKVG